MKDNLPLPQEKKLMVVFRVEPGCLGPQGAELIEEFCQFAQKQVEDLDADFVHWDIVPRTDKSLPEMQYKVNDKKLTHDKAARYLEVFDKSLDEFEGHLHQKLARLVERFQGR